MDSFCVTSSMMSFSLVPNEMRKSGNLTIERCIISFSESQPEISIAAMEYKLLYRPSLARTEGQGHRPCSKLKELTKTSFAAHMAVQDIIIQTTLLVYI